MSQLATDHRNRNALILLGLCVLFVAAYNWALDPLLASWQERRAELARREQTVEQLRAAVAPDRFDRKVLQRVGRLELPADALTQQIRFKRRLEEQFKQAGIRIDGDPQFEGRPVPLSGTPYRLARLTVTGSGKHDNLLKLADTIYDNPYLAGLEEFSVELQGRDRNAANAGFRLKVTVTTLIGS